MYAVWTATITRFQDVIGVADIHRYEVYDVIRQSPACFELSYVDVKTVLSMLSRPNLHKVVVHGRCANRSLNEAQSKENMKVSSDKMEWMSTCQGRFQGTCNISPDSQGEECDFGNIVSGFERKSADLDVKFENCFMLFIQK